MVGIDAEKAVVMKKTDEGGGGKIQHVLRVGGPHGGTHGHEVEVEKVLAEFMTAGEFPQGERREVRLVEEFIGRTEKSLDLGEKAVKARTEKIPALGEDLVDAHAVVFESGGDVLDAEGHLRGFDGDVEFRKEPAEIRIGDLVENDEPGVNRDGPAVFLHRDGVGVAAGAGVLFEEGEPGVLAEVPGAAESGHAGSHDGDVLLQGGVRVFEASS